MMLFQFPLTQPGGQLQSVMYTLQQWGLLDAFLPFLLFFAIIFATMQKIKLFVGADGTKPDRKMNGVISFAIAAMVVVPHITRSYPPEMDPVMITLTILPSAGLLLLVLFLVLILLGLAGKDLPFPGSMATGLIFLIIFGAVVVGAIWPTIIPSWLRFDPNLTALVITLLAFAGIVWFITSEEGEARPGTGEKGIWRFLRDFYGGP